MNRLLHLITDFDVTSNNLDSSWMVKCQYIGNNQYRTHPQEVLDIF